ncbi:MAG: hypothetical protein R2854_13140 [Caldilineaceae bacterium]
MPIELQAYQGPEHEPFLWEGNGTAAVLVHGFPGTPAEMRPVADVLHAAGWTVNGLLLPGFGCDFAKIAQYNHKEWRSAVERAVTDLRAEHERGCWWAIPWIGAGHGRAAGGSGDALLLFAAFALHGRWVNAAFPLIGLFLHEMRPFRTANFDDPQFRAGVHRFPPDADLSDEETQEAIRELSLPISVLGEVRKAGKAGYAKAKRARQPVTIIQGLEDEVASPDLTRAIAARLPNLTHLHMVEGGHDLTLLSATYRDALVDIITGFVDNVNAMPPSAGE